MTPHSEELIKKIKALGDSWLGNGQGIKFQASEVIELLQEITDPTYELSAEDYNLINKEEDDRHDEG